LQNVRLNSVERNEKLSYYSLHCKTNGGFMTDKPKEAPASTSRAESQKGGRKAKRDAHFPKADKSIWLKSSGSWAAMPKTLLLIAQLVGAVEKDSLLPSTLIGLWLSTYDDGYVAVGSEGHLAVECGFTQKQNNRRIFEWRKRVKRLDELNFVELEAKERLAISHILIKDPHDAILAMHKAGRFNNSNFDDLRERLGDRALDVGVTRLKPLINPSALEEAPETEEQIPKVTARKRKPKAPG
jgi:hypothetical protein